MWGQTRGTGRLGVECREMGDDSMMAMRNVLVYGSVRGGRAVRSNAGLFYSPALSSSGKAATSTGLLLLLLLSGSSLAPGKTHAKPVSRVPLVNNIPSLVETILALSPPRPEPRRGHGRRSPAYPFLHRPQEYKHTCSQWRSRVLCLPCSCVRRPARTHAFAVCNLRCPGSHWT